MVGGEGSVRNRNWSAERRRWHGGDGVNERRRVGSSANDMAFGKVHTLRLISGDAHVQHGSSRRRGARELVSTFWTKRSIACATASRRTTSRTVRLSNEHHRFRFIGGDVHTGATDGTRTDIAFVD